MQLQCTKLQYYTVSAFHHLENILYRHRLPEGFNDSNRSGDEQRRIADLSVESDP